MTTLLFLQRALRVDDNPALQRVRRAERLIVASARTLQCSTPLADPFRFHYSDHRHRFRLECLADLDRALQQRHLSLNVIEDNRAETLAGLLMGNGVRHLVMDPHPDPQQQRSFEAALVKVMPRLRIESVDCNSLFSAEQLAVDADCLPQVFGQFRRHVEKCALKPGPIEPLATLSIVASADAQMTARFSGGEQAGLAHLHRYLFDDRHVSHYKATRNGLLNESDGSRFSVWLADGALSPRRIWIELDRYVETCGEDEHTQWLRVELLWREFFRWNLLLKGSGRYLRETSLPVLSDEKRRRLTAWQQGCTGVDFVDANMIELCRTGFMSNRGRQNVASFLIHDLEVHWLYGAIWFEQQLIDFDLASNLGNWAYIAGCGHDPRQGRRFNIQRQASEYDPDGAYVRRWLTSRSLL